MRPINLSFPGNILREKRESLGFSFQDITDHLSIPSDVIQAFESGDARILPKHTFAEGFLRSYCTFLGLEAEMMVAELQLVTKRQKALSAAKESTLSFQLPRLRLPHISIPISGEVLAWISVTALLVFGWFVYTTFAPSADPADSNTTQATTIDLRVPEVSRARDKFTR
jgi:cytoskeleton protein RodZ